MAEAVVSAKHRSFAIPFDAGLANIVVGARKATLPNLGSSLIVPHTRDTTRLARNLGHTVPAPILSQYNWNGDTPFKTQIITAAALTMNYRMFVLSEMGTGKTRATLHALNFLLQEKEISRALVAAPLSTLTNVWDAEVFRHFSHLRTSVLYGDKAKRLKQLGNDADIYIINHDGIETILPELVARTDIDLIIIDEVAVYRNSGTNRWKAMNVLVNGELKRGHSVPSAPRKYAWGLTGSPTPNEPTDAWGQCRLLAPARVPVYFKQFQRQTMSQVSQFRWIPRSDAKDIVAEAMQPAVRFTRDECVELPPTVYQSRPVVMDKEQARVYKEMMTKLKVAFGIGQVTAVNEGVLFSKLLQVASGWVYTTDKRVVTLGCKNRLDSLTEVIDETEGKTIVFVDFVHAAKEVHTYLAKKGYASALVTGDVPAYMRNTIFNDFQNGGTPRVLVAHPKCMAHGLTLTAASTVCWFSPTTSLETYEQACARITRPGQTRKTLIVHLTGTPVESRLYRRLQQKASTQGALLELFEEP